WETYPATHAPPNSKDTPPRQGKKPPARDLERDWGRTQREEKPDGGGHRNRQI
ncbi:unnamed protein product, partial [Brassica oleracea var. botrytis]